MSAPEPTDTLNRTQSTASDAAQGASNPAPTAEANAEAAPGAAAANSSADALAAAKKEAADNYDRYLRAVADMENLRRRSAREKDELRQYAASKVLEDLLPVLDNLGLGIAAAKQPNADVKTLVGGVEMVLNQLKSALSNHGLQEINPAGQPFDPNLHESVAAQPSAEVADGNVLNVIRVGYSLNGRLLRPATVVLSSGAPQADRPVV